MRLRLRLVLAALLGALLLASACGGGETAQEPPVAGPIAIDQQLLVIPQRFETLIFANVQAFRADQELVDAYQSFQASAFPTVGSVGVSFESVATLTSYIAATGTQPEELTVVEGEFDEAALRAGFQRLGFNPTVYNQRELWARASASAGPGDFGALYLHTPNRLALGSAEQTVRQVIDLGGTPALSLGVNKDLRDVLARVPQQLLVFASARCQVAQCGAVAIGFAKKNKDTLAVRAIYKFTDQDTATRSLGAVSDSLRESSFADVKTSAAGQFVVMVGSVKTRDLLQ